MRTWILFAGILVAEAVNPGYDYPDVFLWYTGVLFIGGIICDIIELKSRFITLIIKANCP